MAEEKSERLYPVRSLHDFLSELNREWDKFRIGSLIGMITSGALLVFFISRLLVKAIRQRAVIDFTFLIIIVAFLIYSIYALFAQYRFFKRWERRVGLLLHLEEELIGEKLGESASKQHA
jgi:hypothetical protein